MKETGECHEFSIIHVFLSKIGLPSNPVNLVNPVQNIPQKIPLIP
jgi:hypothetical protein